MQNFIRRLSSSQIIILGFAAVILLGSLLLMLPFSTVHGQGAPFADALFTATSAVCVTGLVVHDTATYWSTFGQTVIILLIQIGGMGVVTIAVALYSISGKRISLKQRSTMQESISAHKLEGIVGMTGFIIRMTLVFELMGALLFAPVFIPRFGLLRGIGYSVFHSISAFCNAGFDLMGIDSPYSSVTAYVANPLVNIAIMSLIVIGGIGFLTWDDIRCNGLHFRRYQLQSKVAIVTSLLLIFIPVRYPPHSRLQLRGPDKAQRLRRVHHDNAHAGGRFPGFNCRRHENHHFGSAYSECHLRIPSSGQCPFLRPASLGRYGAQRLHHFCHVPHTVYCRRPDNQPGGAAASANLPF